MGSLVGRLVGLDVTSFVVGLFVESLFGRLVGLAVFGFAFKGLLVGLDWFWTLGSDEVKGSVG